MASSLPVHAVLLDVDGTLIDSNAAQAQSWLDAFKEAGMHVDAQHVRRLIGKGGDRLLREAADLDIDVAPGKSIASRHKAIFAERYLPTLRATPGARDLLVWLRARGAQLVIATSAGEEEMQALLQAASVDDLFDTLTSSDDAAQTKPDPDIIQAALAKAKRPAAECVMIGDTPYDGEAARRAGVAFIGLRSGGWSAEDLHGGAVFDDPADLLANYRNSPLARLKGVADPV